LHQLHICSCEANNNSCLSRYLSALTLSYLMLHEQNEEELIENGVLEGLEEFMAQHTPKQIFECEKLRWKFMTPFLEPTLSRHLTVQKMGMFAIASLAYSGMYENPDFQRTG